MLTMSDYNIKTKFLGSLSIAQSKITSEIGLYLWQYSLLQKEQTTVENPKIDFPETRMYGVWRD